MRRLPCTELAQFITVTPSAYSANAVAWTNDPIQVLGVTVAVEDTTKVNFTPILDKSRAILNTWKCRGLSLQGKIQVINTLIASLVVYKMSVLLSLEKGLIDKFESIFNDFLWNGRKAKIPLRTLQLNKKSGGLQLVNLKNKDMALKITWIRTLLNDEKIANLVYSFFKVQMGNDIWMCNIAPEHVSLVIDQSTNRFWFDVLTAWSVYNFSRESSGASQMLCAIHLLQLMENLFFGKSVMTRI